MSFLIPSNLDISVYAFSNPDQCFEACVLLTVLLTQPLWQESQLQIRTYYERTFTNLVSTHRHLELRTHSILGSSLEISVLVITFRPVDVLKGFIANTNHKVLPNVCRQRQVQRAGTYLTFLCLVSNWQQNKWVGIAVYFLSWLVKKKQKLCLQTKLFS